MKIKISRSPLFWVVMVGLALRLAVALYMGEEVIILPGISDQVSYHTLATRVAQGAGFTFPTQWWPVTAPDTYTAFWSYLYTFYLTVVYAIFGLHPLAARLLQAALVGTLTPWLAYRLARRVFDEKSEGLGRCFTSPQSLKLPFGLDVPLLAAAWVGFYGYFIYYSAALMTEMFYITGILWALDCAQRIALRSRPSVPNPQSQIRNYLELGLAIGITVLLRQVFLTFVPFLLAWLLWVAVQQGRTAGLSWPRSAWRMAWQAALGLLVTAALIAPITLWNYHQFGRFVLLNTNAGYAFFWANHPVHGERFVPLFTPDMPTYQELIPEELRSLNEAELDNALMQRGMQFVLDEPLRYLKLCISRLPAHFIFWPLPGSSLASNLTRVGSLGLALPFMLLGTVLWAAGPKDPKGLQKPLGSGWPGVVALTLSPGFVLQLFAWVYAGVHLLSWAGIRYRLPTDAVLLIFAAWGLAWLVGKVFKAHARLVLD